MKDQNYKEMNVEFRVEEQRRCHDCYCNVALVHGDSMYELERVAAAG